MKLREIYSKKDFRHNAMLDWVQPAVSFEIFPPKCGEQGYQTLFSELEQLKKYNPVLVSLTWGAGGNNNNSFDLIKKINEKFNVMPHFTCICNNCDNVEEHIKDIANLGIENILALRGDEPQDIDVCHMDFKYANDLVRFIKSKSNLSAGVAGYPEGHIEAPDLFADIENLKRKVDEGADVIYTQLFFDNDKFFSYVQLVRDAGIHIPIVPGIMPIVSMKQVKRMTSMAKVSVPKSLMERLERFEDSPEDMKKLGVDFASYQCQQLIDAEVAGLHFYTLNKAYSTSQILDNVLGPVPEIINS